VNYEVLAYLLSLYFSRFNLSPWWIHTCVDGHLPEVEDSHKDKTKEKPIIWAGHFL